MPKLYWKLLWSWFLWLCSYCSCNFKKNIRVWAINRVGPHDYNVLCLLIGGLLGDMFGTLIKGKTLDSVRFGLEQSTKNSAYLISVWEFFKFYGYVSDKKPFIQNRVTGNNSIRFYLYTYTSLLWVFLGFYNYKDGHYVKSVPSLPA